MATLQQLQLGYLWAAPQYTSEAPLGLSPMTSLKHWSLPGSYKGMPWNDLLVHTAFGACHGSGWAWSAQEYATRAHSFPSAGMSLVYNASKDLCKGCFCLNGEHSAHIPANKKLILQPYFENSSDAWETHLGPLHTKWISHSVGKLLLREFLSLLYRKKKNLNHGAGGKNTPYRMW